MDARQTKIYLAIVIAAIVFGVILLYFALSIIRQQRRNMALQKALILAEMDTLEKERSRIAADLHDDLGPVLSVIKFRVDFAKENNEELQKASVQLDDIVVRLREIATDLMPVALQRKGLSVAIEEFIQQAQRSAPFPIVASVAGELPVKPEKALHIFRTVQELVHNCLKHASPQQLKLGVSLARTNLLLIDYADDGKGFNEKVFRSPGGGIGLRSIQNRTELVGGSMFLQTKPGYGTKIQIEIPV